MALQTTKKIVLILLLSAAFLTVPGTNRPVSAATGRSSVSDYKKMIYDLKKNAADSNNSKILNFLDQAETFFNTAEKMDSPKRKEHYFNLAVKYLNFAKKEFLNFDIKKTELTNKKNNIKRDSQDFFKQNFFSIKTKNRIDNYIRKIEFLLEKNDLENAKKVLDIVSSVYDRQVEHSKKFSDKVKDTEAALQKADDIIRAMLIKTNEYNFKKINDLIYRASDMLDKAKKSVAEMKFDHALETAQKAVVLSEQADKMFSIIPHYELLANKLINRLINTSANLFKANDMDVKFAESVRNRIFDIQMFSETQNHQETVKICRKLIAMIDYYRKADGIPVDSMCKAVDNIEIPKPGDEKQTQSIGQSSENISKVNTSDTQKDSIADLINSRKRKSMEVSENSKILKKSISVSDKNQKIMAVIQKAELMVKKAENLIQRLENNSIKRGSDTPVSSKNIEITKGIVNQCNDIVEILKKQALENFRAEDSSFDLNNHIKKLGVMEKYLDFASGIK
jgi:hypothetical protein